jgi:hypothetical protein
VLDLLAKDGEEQKVKINVTLEQAVKAQREN